MHQNSQRAGVYHAVDVMVPIMYSVVGYFVDERGNQSATKLKQFRFHPDCLPILLSSYVFSVFFFFALFSCWFRAVD